MMKTLILTLFLFSFKAFAVSWEQPPILCVEEILPQGFACLDFSKVEDIFNDFPDSTTPDEILEWRNHRSADLRFCRSREVLRREALSPGKFSPASIQISWMVVNGAQEVQKKVQAIYNSAKNYSIPPHVLSGALKQESLFSSLGISPDGGNFSCGMAQLNIQEWCRYMKSISIEQKNKLDWPLGIKCNDDQLPTDIVSPLYELALNNLKIKKPAYQISKDDFSRISFEEISAKSKIDKIQFQAVMSFVNHCQEIELSIAAKAMTLKSLYDTFVPESMKKVENYSQGETFQRSCQTPYDLKQYPLHTGWLLAVAMYNAGPIEVKVLDHYYDVKYDIYPLIHPDGLIEALHWGGKWKRNTKLVEFEDQSGEIYTQSWFKSCIVQRHIARVVQHVTIPGQNLVKSLEQAPCSLSLDVPEYRQISSGKKN